MTVRLRVKEAFKQQWGCEEKNGKETPIIYEYQEGQIVIGDEAKFMSYKHPDKFECIEGKFIPKTFDADVYLVEEHIKEDALRQAVKEDPEANKKAARKREKKKK